LDAPVFDRHRPARNIEQVALPTALSPGAGGGRIRERHHGNREFPAAKMRAGPDERCAQRRDPYGAMRTVVPQYLPSSWTDAYRLEHCEGFRVDSDEGCLGYVEEIVWSEDGSAPLALHVRRGFGAGGLVVVPVADVVALSPDGGSIVVGTVDPEAL
jgi:hypothetical protein